MIKYIITFISLGIFPLSVIAEEGERSQQKQPDFGAMFTKALSSTEKNAEKAEDEISEEDKIARAQKNILVFADTHIAESDYAAALDLLGETPDGSAQWYEIYGSAALGDRQQSKALWAFTEAKKLYEEQDNSSKVNEMRAMINALTPR